MDKLNIRVYTWLANGLSWAYVCERLVNAFDNMGHNTYIISTNGINESSFSKGKMVESIIGLDKLKKTGERVNIDLTYTVPQNFPQRFLANSKHKCVIYNYETTFWDPQWKKYYGLADFYFPSSNFSAEVFYLNGVPPEKTFVIPHGIDTSVFNPDIPPIKLRTNKKFKFVSVVAPHYRKNIDLLLEAYCEAFTNKDDVCLVLKTKILKHSDPVFDRVKCPNGRKPFEIILGDIFKKLYKKYGKENMPEIEVLSGHVENVSSVYNACDCHVSATGAEGFGMIFPEAAACGLLNIAPRYSGQLDFLNDDNALLSDVKIRKARPVEQYWTFNPKSTISEPVINHLSELMIEAYKRKDELLKKLKPEADKMVSILTWEYAAQRIIDAVNGNLEHYLPGTYDLKKQHKIKNSKLRIY